MVESILAYLWQALSATLIQILILFAPGLLLTLILYFETRFIQSRTINRLGLKWYLGLFGWLGTIIHELGHVLFCLIFWHKITEMKLLAPDPETGTLGYVKHSYNPKNVYQLAGNFFIGIGPILLGTVAIFLLSYWLLRVSPLNPGTSLVSIPSSLGTWDILKGLFQNLWNSSRHLLVEIFSWQHLFSWQLYLFVYLAFAIGSSLALSPPDIKAALGGFGVILILIFIINVSTVWAGNFISAFVIGISGYYAVFYAAVFLIVLINVAVSLFITLPLSQIRPNHAKGA